MRYSLFLVLVVLLTPFATAFVCTAEQTTAYITGDSPESQSRKAVDYVFVIDRSGSMQGEKLETVKQAAKTLIANLPATDRAAIISFNYDATTNQELTSDHAALDASLDGIEAEFGTKYAPPLLLSQRQFSKATNEKALVFLSDGKGDFSEQPQEILTLTEQLARNGACIMTISYALDGEQSSLLELMAQTGKQYGCGEHFIASEKGNELSAVFEEIRSSVSAQDVIVLDESFSQRSYGFTFKNRKDGSPIPGVSASGCADSPAFTMTIMRGAETVLTTNQTHGTLDLDTGIYEYYASATLTCGGQCSYIGKSEGEFSIGDACTPEYQDLATYVTGDVQTVIITPTGFLPGSISGRQGTLVAWTNQDAVSRRIVSEQFDERVEPGETYTYVIENVGTLVYTDPERNITGSVRSIAGKGTDILLVIDESGSMKGEGIAEARVAAQKFFSLLSPQDRGALVTFSETAQVLQDFTSDKGALLAATTSLRSEGATSYLSALEAVRSLKPVQRPVLVFMSDGAPTDQGGNEPILDATAALRDQGWCLMTVGFGEEGAAARTLLTRMAGTDECTAFLYAASGRLSETFGTIYQLSQSTEDLTFTKLDVPFITVRRTISFSTQLLARTGRSIPGSTAGLCSREASIQARSDESTTILTYEDDHYYGSLAASPGIHRVVFIATVTTPTEPGRAFIGTTARTVIVVPPWAIIVLMLFLAAIVIYTLRRRAAV